jgi:hypothetical protein
MLPLDDPRWSQLRHAYGDASDIPDLLRALARSPAQTSRATDEPWFSLWSSLCHQGDIYTASYAAVSHIIDIAMKTETPVDYSFFSLPATVEGFRLLGLGPPVPDYIAEGYRAAIGLLVECVHRHDREPWDRSMLLSALSALAAAKGHGDVAIILSNIDGSELEAMIRDGIGE